MELIEAVFRNDYGFAPEGLRARALDLRMRVLLAESLDHIRDRGGTDLGVDPAALSHVIDGLGRGDRFGPAVFGLYRQAVLAIMDDDLPTAGESLGQIAASRPVAAPPAIVAIDDPALADHRDLLLDTLDIEATSGCRVRAPAPATVAAFTQRLAVARDLTRRAVPELAAEFDALTTQVILVGSDPTTDMQFDGGSSYMLWGGLFLNVDRHPDEISLVEVLAHESAHTLLFAFAADEPLVHNDDEPRYASPLRADPRPMDGIYHATYVSARMHWVMSQLLASGLLDAAGREQAEAARAADARNFADGHAVVAAHGDLTATGAAAMRAAALYMEGCGAA